MSDRSNQPIASQPTISQAPLPSPPFSSPPVSSPPVSSPPVSSPPIPGAELQVMTDPLVGLEGQVVAGRYRVLQKLGEGGMGIVYLAEHITIEKKVALKVLLHEYARKQDLKERFLQEAKAAARIGHENIVDITDFGPTPDGSVFFAMEYLEGKDLSQVIRDDGPLPWPRAKTILLQICRALGAAHAKQIVHRDMKPENIYLIEREGQNDFAKLLDFGIAKMSMEQGEKRLTRTGMIFGTPEYMSPEQAQGNKPDHRVDIYAMGVITYEMLTGSVPFKADTFMGILTKHIFENPVPPSQVNPNVAIPAEVEEVILKAMAKDRTERFQSMTEMAAGIAQASGRVTRASSDHPQQLPPRRIASPSQTYAPVGAKGGIAQVPTVGDDLEVPTKSKLPLIIGVVGAVVVLGGVAAALALRGSDDPAKVGPQGGAASAKPDAAAPSSRIQVTVKSKPTRAKVFLGAAIEGKEPAGVTPATLSLPKGDKRILLTLQLDGYADSTLEVVPSKDKELFTQLVPAKRLEPAAKKPKKPEVVRPPPPKVVRRPPPKRVPRRPPPKRQPPRRPRPKQEKVDDLMNPFD
jgi:serine/threonine-protein kinase